jgi:hypothetical protein
MSSGDTRGVVSFHSKPFAFDFNLYSYSQAAGGFQQLAECHLKLDSKHEAASAYVEAANANKKVRVGATHVALQCQNVFLGRRQTLSGLVSMIASADCFSLIASEYCFSLVASADCFSLVMTAGVCLLPVE